MSFIDDKRMLLLSLANELEAKEKLIIASKRTDFKSLSASLDALSPLSVISRGYAAVFSGDRLIKSAKQLSPGDNFTLRLSDGNVIGEVKEIIEEDK